MLFFFYNKKKLLEFIIISKQKAESNVVKINKD